MQDVCLFETRGSATPGVVRLSHPPAHLAHKLLTHLSDFNLPPLSSLSLQQQRENESRAPRTYNTRSTDQHTDIPAPIPTRASIVPAMQSPSILPTAWTPEMGIKFGGSAPQPPQVDGNANQGQPKTWDPNAGFRFS